MRQAEAAAEAAKAAGDRDPGDRASWPAFTYQVTTPTRREQFVSFQICVYVNTYRLARNGV